MSALEQLSPAAQAAWRASSFAPLPEQAQDTLLETAIELEAESGQIIYRELHKSTSAFLALVTYGLVRVFVSSARGREVTIRHLKRGDITGIPAMVANGAPQGVEAVTKCGLVAFQVRALRTLARNDPAVAWTLCQELTKIVLEVTDVLAETAFKSINERVARTLLERARPDGGTLSVEVSQQEIADEIGSVREVVSRALRQLRTEGLVDRKDNRIVLLDPVSLSRLVDQENSPPR